MVSHTLMFDDESTRQLAAAVSLIDSWVGILSKVERNNICDEAGSNKVDIVHAGLFTIISGKLVNINLVYKIAEDPYVQGYKSVMHLIDSDEC